MALSIPNSLVEAGRRMKHNLCHFRTSYAIFILFIFFLGLFGHSFPMVILINFVFGCFLVYLYGADPNPIVLSNCCTLDSIAILAVLGVFTNWVLLLLTNVWLNVLVSILIGSALAGLHALFRRTEDLHLDHGDQEPYLDRELVEVVGNNPNTTPTASDADQQPDEDCERVGVVDVGNPTTSTTTTASNVAD